MGEYAIGSKTDTFITEGVENCNILLIIFDDPKKEKICLAHLDTALQLNESFEKIKNTVNKKIVAMINFHNDQCSESQPIRSAVLQYCKENKIHIIDRQISTLTMCDGSKKAVTPKSTFSIIYENSHCIVTHSNHKALSDTIKKANARIQYVKRSRLNPQDTNENLILTNIKEREAGNLSLLINCVKNLLKCPQRNTKIAKEL